MANPNAPAANDENIERKSSEPLQNLHKLYKAGLERSLLDEHGNIDPIKFDSLKKDPAQLKDEIIEAMKQLRYDDMVNFGNLTETEIDTYFAYYNINIRTEIARFGLPLVNERKKFRERALELFPQLSDVGDFDERLMTAISSMNVDELKKYTQRSAYLRKFLKGKELFESELSGAEIHFHMRKVFLDDLDIYFGDAQKRAKLEHIFQQFERSGLIPSWADISFLIGAYLYNPSVTVPEEQKSARLKQVFVYFGAQVSLKDAYHKMGWIDDEQIEKLFQADPEFNNLFHDSSLTKEERKTLISRLSYNDQINISVRDLDFTKLPQILKKNKSLRKHLVDAITNTIDIENIDAENAKDSDILIRTKMRFLKQSKERGLDEQNYDQFEEYKNQLLNYEPNFLQSGQFPIRNFKNFREGSYLVVDNGDDQLLVRLAQVYDKNGGLMSTQDGESYGLQLECYGVRNGIADAPILVNYSYTEFTNYLGTAFKGGKVYTNEEFNSQIRAENIGDAGKQNSHTKKQIFLRPAFTHQSNQEDTISSHINTPESLLQELDMLDVEGMKYGFGVGTSFIASSVEEGTGKMNHDDIWTVTAIGDGVVSLMDSDGHELVKDFPIHSLYRILADTSGFKRIAKITTDREFLDQFKAINDIGLDGDIHLEDGRIQTKSKDDHGHEISKYINTFAGDKGGHIRIGHIDPVRKIVHFGDYTDAQDIQKMKDYAKKHGLDNKLKGYYDWKSMSFAAFIEFTKKNKLKAQTKDPILPEEASHHFHSHEHDHHDHSHLHGNFLQKVMKLQNPASIMKGFEMIFHAVEHTLEKGAKLDSARFALGTSRFLKLPASVQAQIYADVVEGSKEIVEKYEKKIFGLPGPAQRWKCIHIAHNKDSRPEEVAAAIKVMMNSYGQLYAEDIKHYQSIVTPENIEEKPPGYFAFFDAMVITAKIPGGLINVRKKAYKKAVQEMGTIENHEGHPTEEQLLHALFKTIDGNWEDFPYAASVVKALGGPSGYEKIWKFEGFETAFKKGKEQTQMVNAQGRLNKAVGYLATHEIYKFMGAMEAVAGKVKEPEFQACPFIWAVGGFSRYASHTALQKLKFYAEGGLTFHAYSFLRNQNDNDTYKKTVELALKELGGDKLVNEFRGKANRLEFNQDNPEATKDAAADMMLFWQRWCHKGLHDMLQGHNGWLLRLRNEGNETAMNYWSTFSGKHSMQLKDSSIPGTDFGKDWADEHGYQSLIMGEYTDKDTGKTYKSIYPMLNKIRFEGGSIGGGARAMNDVHKEKIWRYIVGYMNGGLRDANMFGSEELMKEQYLVHRKEIIEYLAQQLGARNPGNVSQEQFATNMRNHIRTYPYYQDLNKMGISPEAVFRADLQVGNADADYKRWRSGQSASYGVRGSVSQSIMNNVLGGDVDSYHVTGINAEGRVIHDDDVTRIAANEDIIPEAE